MGRQCWLSACVVVLGLILAGGHSPAGEEKGVALTDKDDKRTVKLPKGTSLTLKLSGNPTTGFKWVVAKNDKDKLPQQGETEYVKDPKAKIGGGGTFVLKFKAEKAGTTELEVEYKRPFEKDKPAAK